MRVMAIDYGSRATGIAISDELQLTVRPLTTLRTDRRGTAPIIEKIVSLAAEYEVGTVLVGLPLRLDGTRGDAATLVERFASRLKEQIGVPVVLRDERLTSRAADELMRQQGASAKTRRAKSDEIAAAILLEDYLAEAERNRATEETEGRSLPKLEA
jgi:putative Holliday junction resolvase